MKMVTLIEIKNMMQKLMKNKKFFFLPFFALLTMAFLNPVHAQLQSPAPSPAAMVAQNVGFTKISIEYSSPGVKGRQVFGDLQKYGETWRAGANEPTMVTFSTGVNIGGTNLAPGKYSLFITPQESGAWTIHLNGKGNAIYDYMKDGKVDEAALAADDAVAIQVNPETNTDPMERLTYSISAEDNKVAKVTFAWEEVKLSFMVDTQVDQKMESFKGALN
jgi:hypothetical protein